MSKYVAYFRVSTARQGQSGLGLEAQQAAVLRFLPGEAIRVADFIEVESGRKSARPQLLAAIALAQREDAVLLVAKLDRLARSVAFLATLMESRVRFQAVDLPAADEFTLHILAAVAQKEASAISSRTRDALAAKKARGFILGTPANLTDEAKHKGLVARQTNALANVNNRQAAQLATLLKANGGTLRAIADQLNQSGYCTRRGKVFHPMGVQRLLTNDPHPPLRKPPTAPARPVRGPDTPRHGKVNQKASAGRSRGEGDGRRPAFAPAVPTRHICFGSRIRPIRGKRRGPHPERAGEGPHPRCVAVRPRVVSPSPWTVPTTKRVQGSNVPLNKKLVF